MIRSTKSNIGQSAMVGVIIMVAITVIISVVVADFVIEAGESLREGPGEDSVDYNVETTYSNISITINSINNESIKFVKVTNPDGQIIGIARNYNETITGERLDGYYEISVVIKDDSEYYIDTVEI